mgnify:CR=1 FL=1
MAPYTHIAATNSIGLGSPEPSCHGFTLTWNKLILIGENRHLFHFVELFMSQIQLLEKNSI